MKKIELDNIEEGKYYMVYGKNWLAILQLITKRVGSYHCDISYMQYKNATIEEYHTPFLINLTMEDQETFELSDEEIGYQILSEIV